MPVVSVIIPVYNGEKYIERCILSVLGQTAADLEILVINDGSRDGTREILERLAGRDGRIRAVHQENQGVSAARNRGIALARGAYLTFLDADDYIGSRYIEVFLEAARKTGAQLLLCGLTRVDEAGRVQDTLIPGTYVRYQKEEWVFRVSCAASHFYARTLWEQYPIRFGLGVRGEDMPVSLFFGAVCDRIATVPSAEYYYVQHGDSAMHRFRGLAEYKLPYQALEEAICLALETGIANSREYFELFVLRILATFIQLAKGAERAEKEALAAYIKDILNRYFPEYDKNPKARLRAKLEVPFAQKAAVWALVRAARLNLLEPFIKLVCR